MYNQRMKAKDQIISRIQDLEIKISKLEIEQGGPYGDLFPKILKLIREMQKLRDML